MKKEDTKEKEKDKKENEKEEAPEPEAKKDVIQMKKGDYGIHILIEEVKNLCMISEDQLPFPIIKVTALGKTQRTDTLSVACKDHVFTQHLYFEGTDLSTEQLDSEKVVIEAYDQSHSSQRSDYFGINEFDFEYIYNRPDHSINNLWMALANPEAKNMSEVRGYLKLSMSVLHADDPRVELQMKDTEGSNCLVPPQIKIKFKQISIHIFRGEELPDMDCIIGKEKKIKRRCNGYVEVKYLGISRKTHDVEMENERIIWNEVIDIPVSDPAVSQKIVMIVADKDLTSDDIVGAIEIKVSDIYAGKYEELTYLDIYGAPENKKGGMYDMMNFNSEIGSKWRGRILAKITWKDVETPVTQVTPFKDEEFLTKVKNTGRACQWTLYCKVLESTFLPTADNYYGVRIMIQDTGETFEPKKAANRSLEWNTACKLQVPAMTDNKDELADVFIYLLNKDKDFICFQRIKAAFFYMNTDVMVIKLLPDPCLNKVSDVVNSGILKVRICLAGPNDRARVNTKLFEAGKEGPQSAEPVFQDDEDEDDLEVSSKKEVKQAVPEATFTVAAIVYMSKHLIAADSTGTSDPYVILTTKEQSLKTSVKYQTINGIWNEKLVFENVKMSKDDIKTWPMYQLCVTDKNTIQKDELIGFSYLWLCDSAYGWNSTELVNPKWEQLTLPKSGRKLGAVLLAFYVFDEQHKDMVHRINYTPETQAYTAEINVLGLRELKPLSLIPVKKSFIKFDMNSLNVTGKEEDALQPIQTLPRDSGPNPTINTVFTVDLKLPVNPIFMPLLQCEVYDFLLSGVMKSLLGLFTLRIKSIIDETNIQIAEDIHIANKTLSMYISDGAMKSNLFKLQPTIANVKKEPEDEIIDTSSKQDRMTEPLLGDGEKESLDTSKSLVKSSTFNDQLTHTAEYLKQNLHNSFYFVLPPVLKRFIVPGQGRAQTEEQKKENVDPELLQKEMLVEDEAKAYDSSTYFGVGYLLKVESDAKPETFTKHYRRIYRRPLEEIPELGLKSPFLAAKVKRGRYEDKKGEVSLFDTMKDVDSKILKRFLPGEISTGIIKDSRKSSMNSLEKDMGKSINDKIQVGKFKGLIRICEKKKMDEYNNTLKKCKDKDGNFLEKFKKLGKYDALSRNILLKKRVVVRVYVLELNSLAKKDAFSESDPYIKIIIGNTVINESKSHQDDQKNCKWYKKYDIPVEIPGDSILKLEVWDYDPLMTDDIIGSTMIDLEDRYFDSTWQDLIHKPIEIRPLYHPDIKGSQGEVYMWLEMLNPDGLPKPIPIAQEPITHLELRFVVWETEGMEAMDVEGTSDMYVIAYLKQDQKERTDVHYRCTTGTGSFNWRMLIPVDVPSHELTLFLDVYDADLFSADDLICQTKMNLKEIVKVPKLLELPIKFTRDYYKGLNSNDKQLFPDLEFMSASDDPDGIKFWIQCSKGGQKKDSRILCSFDILPQSVAEANKVGKGREEPNLDPFLPPPVGRFEWSLNPFKMLNQLVGPKFRRKMYCYICLCLLVVYLCVVIPYIIYHVTGYLMNPLNWFGSKK